MTDSSEYVLLRTVKYLTLETCANDSMYMNDSMFAVIREYRST